MIEDFFQRTISELLLLLRNEALCGHMCLSFPLVRNYVFHYNHSTESSCYQPTQKLFIRILLSQ